MIDLNALGFNRTGGGGAAPSGLVAVTAYSGNGTTQNINTGQNLTPGAMAWLKLASGGTGDHGIFDTVRGASKLIKANVPEAESTVSGVTSFNSDGITIGLSFNTGENMVAFTFIEQTSFLDIVTYTGNGTSQSIAHGLTETPDFMIIRCRDTATGGRYSGIYHGSLGNTKSSTLETSGSFDTATSYWNNTSPTSTHFTVGSSQSTNGSGLTYVAYLFKASPGKCAIGVYSAAGPTVSITGLTFTPKIVLATSSTTSNPWRLLYQTGGSDYNFSTASNAARDASGNMVIIPNGFSVLTTSSSYPNVGGSNVYIAWG